MSRSGRLVAVVALSAVLALQGLWSFATNPEPYPTIRLPGFGSVPNANGDFASTWLDITVTYSDGSTAQPNPVDVADNVRYSSARNTLDYAFRPAKDGRANPRAADPVVVEWLRTRPAISESGQIPEAVTFCWRRATVHISDAEVIKEEPCELAVVKL